jgi:RES domain-containing protein
MSECLSLCVLESLVHMVKVHMMQEFKCVWMDIPKSLVTTFGEKELPENWKAVPAPPDTREIGDRWFDARKTPVLKVPSTVITTEFNFILNPSHKDFHKVKIGEVQDFEFDKRLLSDGNDK